MEKLTLPATIEKISTRADNSIAITISTQELKGQNAATLFNLKGMFGWIMFALEALTDKDIPEEKLSETQTKSQSSRIRACIFKIWDNNTDKSIDFDNFYKAKTEKIITWLKEQI